MRRYFVDWSYCSNSRATLPEIENRIDPDDGISWLCIACRLPIFSTPFQFVAGDKLCLHDECARLPEELSHHLHRGPRLIRKEDAISNINYYSPYSYCDFCFSKLGITFYRCSGCSLQLDVLCAFPIKIMHRSHRHRLMVMRSGPASFTCGACGTEHKDRSPLFYLCNACMFWIHSDCASLPNAVTVLHHQHSLFLTYGLPSRGENACAICREVIRTLGVYICAQCRYFAHIQCAISNPQGFKPVLIREAKLAGLLHFPLNEDTSVMRCIRESRASSSDVVDEYQSEGKFVREEVHQHPLISHGQDYNDESHRVCNACVQLISPPFYSCPECPDFFLHNCCANLPTQIQHPAHKHPLSLFPKAPNSSVTGFFICRGCQEDSNRFSYSCSTCNFDMDVVCALLPPAITHELHGNTHILYTTSDPVYTNLECKCCTSSHPGITYKCSNCHDFAIHARCAMFPSSIKHKYDEHPLKLTIDDGALDKKICEICEETLPSRVWYYRCSQCEQSFHYKCIPSVNWSPIKFGGTIHVDCHDCPLTLVLESTFCSSRCGYCSHAISSHFPRGQGPTYECSKCFFSIHTYCAKWCLVKCERNGNKSTHFP